MDSMVGATDIFIILVTLRLDRRAQKVYAIQLFIIYKAA